MFFVISRESFDSTVSSCVLHVPTGSKGDYEQKGWTMFSKIVDDISPTGLKALTPATKFDGRPYSLDGRRVSAQQSKHIYVVRDKDGKCRKYVAK